MTDYGNVYIVENYEKKKIFQIYPPNIEAGPFINSKLTSMY